MRLPDGWSPEGITGSNKGRGTSDRLGKAGSEARAASHLEGARADKERKSVENRRAEKKGVVGSRSFTKWY